MQAKPDTTIEVPPSAGQGWVELYSAGKLIGRAFLSGRGGPAPVYLCKSDSKRATLMIDR